MPLVATTSEFALYLLREGIRQPEYYVNVLKYIQSHCELTYSSISGFFDQLLLTGTKASTINRYLAVVKSYGRCNHLEWVEELHKFKEDMPRIGLLSDDEIELFLSLSCPPNTPIVSWNRWTLFWTILSFTGMRPRECASLTVSDIDFNSNNFLLWETKTNIPRSVPIPQMLKKILKQYCENREGLLFPVTRRDASMGIMSPSTWRMAFKRRLALLHINRKYLKPYSLRHSYITDLLSNDIGIEKVGKLVGHKNITTTMHYTHLVNKDVQKIINKHPILEKNVPTEELLQKVIKEVMESGLIERKEIQFNLSKTGFSLALS